MNNTPQIDLTLEQMKQRFEHCHAWEERYRQLLLLSKQLKPMDEDKKTPQNLVAGCESEVWFCCQDSIIQLDSNARILKGLLLLVLACVQQHPQQLEKAHNLFNQTLEQLGLAQHLSESRTNGITTIWHQVKTSQL